MEISSNYGSISKLSTRSRHTSLGSAKSVLADLPPTKGPDISPRMRQFYLGVVILLAFSCGVLFSVPAPFFPMEATKKGVSETVIGFVFAVFELCAFIFSPIFGTHLGRIGEKFTLVAGLYVASTCAVLFGFLEFVPGGTTYIALCFVTRAVEGIGVSAYFAAAFAFGASMFPDQLGFVFGLVETGNAIGIMVGPTIGGALYSLDGYYLPFTVLGGFLFCWATLLFVVVPHDLSTAPLKAPTNHTNFYSVPKVYLTMFVMLGTSISVKFMEFGLAIHLDQNLGVHDPFAVGLYYLIPSTVFAVSSPIVGKISDVVPNSSIFFMISGTFIAAVAYLFTGPSPLVASFVPQSLTGVLIAVAFAHGGLGFCITPVCKELQYCADSCGYRNDMRTTALISGVYNGLWFLGGFIGSSLSGILIDALGFEWAVTADGCAAPHMWYIASFAPLLPLAALSCECGPP